MRMMVFGLFALCAVLSLPPPARAESTELAVHAIVESQASPQVPLIFAAGPDWGRIDQAAEVVSVDRDVARAQLRLELDAIIAKNRKAFEMVLGMAMARYILRDVVSDAWPNPEAALGSLDPVRFRAPRVLPHRFVPYTL